MVDLKDVQLRLSKVQRSLPPDLERLCDVVLGDRCFWDAYGAKSHHHNYQGGLAVHTAEVVGYCVGVLEGNPALRRDVLLTAAIWHDYLKVRDYREVDGKPAYTPYKERIYHISGSAMEFYHHARLVGLGWEFTDEVVHCILSHHGRPEWGSVITPQTPEAWTLHYADCMSAWFEDGGYKEKER